MAIARVIKVRNGDYLHNFTIFSCDKCGTEMLESDRLYVIEKQHFCIDCAFRLGYISSETYCRWSSIILDGAKAGINPETGEIEISLGKFSWEKSSRDHRQSADYRLWRMMVFERDRFMCQQCLQVGGRLEAHHILNFSSHKEQRFDINNGITLCLKCHKNIHRKEKPCLT